MISIRTPGIVIVIPLILIIYWWRANGGSSTHRKARLLRSYPRPSAAASSSDSTTGSFNVHSSRSIRITRIETDHVYARFIYPRALWGIATSFCSSAAITNLANANHFM